MEEIQRDRKLGKEAKFFFSKANLSPLDHMYRPICTTCADKHTHTHFYPLSCFPSSQDYEFYHRSLRKPTTVDLLGIFSFSSS